MKYAYIGIKKCGCVVAVTLDCPENPEVAEDVRDFIKKGYTVERISAGEAILKLQECIHNKQEQLKL